MTPQPGEIYWTYLEGPRPRPTIIISRESLNRGIHVVAIPVTSERVAERRTSGNCVVFERGDFGLSKSCVAQAEGVTVVELRDLDLKSGPIGTLDAETFRELVKAVGFMMGAECELA